MGVAVTSQEPGREVVRAALVQSKWTGDKAVDDRGQRRAGAPAPPSQGAQVLCFQELFYGPYFCQVQDPAYFSTTPRRSPGRRPTACSDAGRARPAWCWSCRSTRWSRRASSTTPPSSIDADGDVPRQVPQAPHPPGQGLLGEVLLPPRQPGLPGLRHRGRADRRLHLLRPPLPRRAGAPSVSPARASSSTPRPPAAGSRPTSGNSSSRRRRWPTSTSSARSTASGSRTSATTTSTARRTSSTRAARSWARRRRAATTT